MTTPKHTLARGLLIGAAILGLANGARAGIGDTPLPPVLPGTGGKALHLYSVTGVRTSATVLTSFHCTNTDDADTLAVGIQIFSLNGTVLNDVEQGNGELLIPPGETRTATAALDGTGLSTSVYQEDENILLSADVNQGSARILATGKSLICTAQMLDLINDPPASIVQLPVFKKLKQQGD